MNLQLSSNHRIGIIGGGPAGSFTALHLLQLAREMDLNLNVLIFEPRRFEKPGPGGCNRCAGIISSRVIRGLETLGVTLPEEIIQSEINHSFNQSVNQSINPSTNQFTNRSIKRSINQAIVQSIDQPIDQPINQPINRCFNQLINQVIDQSTDQSIDQLVDEHLLARFGSSSARANIEMFLLFARAKKNPIKRATEKMSY